jgi:hypothetical protein
VSDDSCTIPIATASSRRLADRVPIRRRAQPAADVRRRVVSGFSRTVITPRR